MRDRRRRRRVVLLGEFLEFGELEIVRPDSRRPRTVEQAPRDGADREPRRKRERLLRAGEDEIDAPGVGLDRSSRQRRDGVDEQKGVGVLADRPRDFPERGDHSGRTFRCERR